VIKEPEEHSLRGEQVLGGIFAVAVISYDVEAELLTFDERTHASSLYGGNVNEHIGLAISLLDEAETFGGIKKLYGASVHDDFLLNRQISSALGRLPSVVLCEIEKEDRRARSAKTKFVSKIDFPNMGHNTSWRNPKLKIILVQRFKGFCEQLSDCVLCHLPGVGVGWHR